MEEKALHIINGDGLTERMQELDLPGEIVVWREMLCEGMTFQEVGGKDFVKARKKFLRKHYHITAEDYEEKFMKELAKLEVAHDYDHVVLWFEFDLFCHINMLAAISYLIDHGKNVPMYLVCSKRLPGEEEFTPLSELSTDHLLKHFEHKISLTTEDIEIATLIWELYCSNSPIQLKQQIKKTTNFEYLSSCIRAHIERFPNSRTGINTLEKNILRIIQRHQITSQHQLLGYALQYQGYYGYNDVQMERVLKKLQDFYNIDGERVYLTEKGEKALEGSHNFYQELKNEEYLGGVRMYDFLYESESHRLLKL
ncbi:MAG: DUF1835 domain-containing protein [Salegentibacter sp.]